MGFPPNPKFDPSLATNADRIAERRGRREKETEESEERVERRERR